MEVIHVQASFFTKDSRYVAVYIHNDVQSTCILRYSVQDTSFSLPVNVTQTELSSLINQLLQSKTYMYLFHCVCMCVNTCSSMHYLTAVPLNMHNPVHGLSFVGYQHRISQPVCGFDTCTRICMYIPHL